MSGGCLRLGPGLVRSPRAILCAFAVLPILIHAGASVGRAETTRQELGHETPRIVEGELRELSLQLQRDHASRHAPTTDFTQHEGGRPARPGWETIVFERAEGNFPNSNGWDVSDLNPSSGEDYWDELSCRKFRGTKSLWCADVGNQTDCSRYDNDMFSWMIYGPFSLADALDARAEFYVWSETEAPHIPYDFIFWGASTDGSLFHGFQLVVNTNWALVDFDLTDVPNLGDLTGRSQVWFAFAFISDYTVNDFEGTYLDDILIEKNVGEPVSPDLIVLEISISDDAVATNEVFETSATTKNQGDGASEATTLRYYRSNDPTITTSDVRLSSKSLPGLGPGAEVDSSDEHTITRAGTFWVGACVEEVPGESNVNNNCSDGVEITVGLPDLVAIDISVSDVNPAVGETFTLHATALNQGDTDAEATSLRFYESTDAEITDTDLELGLANLPVLGPQETSPQSTDHLIALAGNYWLGACIDAVTNESDAENNCSHAVRVDIGTCVASDTVVVSDVTVDGTEVWEACDSIVVGPDVVFTSTADVTLRAGQTVEFHESVVVESGAVVRVLIHLPTESQSKAENYSPRGKAAKSTSRQR